MSSASSWPPPILRSTPRNARERTGSSPRRSHSKTGSSKLPDRERMASEQEESMAVDSPSMFAQTIQDHLELKRRNAALEHEMPLEKYMSDDPFENHPLFKTEEQARIEDTMDGVKSIVDEPTSVEWPAASAALLPG